MNAIRLSVCSVCPARDRCGACLSRRWESRVICGAFLSSDVDSARADWSAAK